MNLVYLDNVKSMLPLLGEKMVTEMFEKWINIKWETKVLQILFINSNRSNSCVVVVEVDVILAKCMQQNTAVIDLLN